MKQKLRVLVPLAEGFEEIEMTTIVDVLRRASLEVVLAGVAGAQPCRGSRGIVVSPDCALSDSRGPWDLVVFPGGLKAAESMASDPRIIDLVQQQQAQALPVAAICAAPLILQASQTLPEHFSCHPSVAQRLRGKASDAPVTQAGLVTTSRSAGTAMQFALSLVERLKGLEARREVEEGLAL